MSDPQSAELIPPGEQDAYGARRAAILASKGFSEDEARAALEATIEYRFEGGWQGADPRRPWEPKDVERWIRGAYEKFYDKDGDAAPEDYLDGLVAPREATAPAESQSWPEYRGDDLAKLDDVRLDYLPVLGEGGWIVKGWSHLLSGFVRAGKTEFLTRSVREWVNEGSVVYWLSEEGIQVWALRLRAHPGVDWHRLIVRPAMGMPVRDMALAAFQSEANIVIVDSIRNLLQIKDENDNAEMAAAVRPWVSAARETEKTLILTHHSRKGGGEHGEGVSGGHGLISVIDVILEVKRDSTGENRRILSSLARVIAPKRETYELDPDTGGMEFKGSPEGLKAAGLRSRLLAVLEEADEGLTTQEVIDRMTDPKPGRTAAYDALKRLVDEGRLLSEGRPARYLLAIRGLVAGGEGA